jgi:hypothetical protein
VAEPGYANGIASLETTGGGFSTQNLPAYTTAAWVQMDAKPGASVTASLTTSGPVTGSFTVVPATATTGGAPMTYLDPVVCPLIKGTPLPSNRFTVQTRVTYDAALGSWYMYVTVPGPGRVNIGSKGTLVPTTAGKAALKSAGSIRLRLIVEFSPKNGKPANKVLALTLTK